MTVQGYEQRPGYIIHRYVFEQHVFDDRTFSHLDFEAFTYNVMEMTVAHFDISDVTAR